MTRPHRYTVAAVVAAAFIGVSAHAACGTTTFTPNRKPIGSEWTYPTTPATHQVIYLTDGANQQHARFDLEWGGGLVSLKYKPDGGILQADGSAHPSATELIWGHDPGAMAQIALWTGNSMYNPNQAGDVGIGPSSHGRGSPVYTVACKGEKVVIQTTTADYGRNDPPWGNDLNYGRAAMIKGGVPVTDMWFTPYAVTFTASFVPNPNGAPANYLRIEQFIHSTDVREFFNTVLANFALYAPHSFTFRKFEPGAQNPGDPNPCQNPSNACLAANTPRLMVGLYPNSAGTGGVAIATNAQTQLAGTLAVRQALGFDDWWGNQSVYLEAERWALPQGTGRRWVVYIQAGDWNVAKLFSPE